MIYLKTYEGFFDVFKKKRTEDDNIALEYINRLKKVHGISPYKITEDINDDGHFRISKLDINFEDTEIQVVYVESSFIFNDESLKVLNNKEFSKYNDQKFYRLRINCEGSWETCKANIKLIKQLYELAKSVYLGDKEATRIDKIKTNINKAADLIPGEEETN